MDKQKLDASPAFSHTIAGKPFNPQALARLTKEDLVELYRYSKGRTDHLEHPDQIKEAFPDFEAIRSNSRTCGEGQLTFIRRALEERGADPRLELAEGDDIPSVFESKWFYTEKIAVKYTTSSGCTDAVAAAPPTGDAEVKLPVISTQICEEGSGPSIGWIRKDLASLHPDNDEVAPPYVQKVGLIAEYALSQFLSSPFAVRDPRDRATRLEIRLLLIGGLGVTDPEVDHIEIKITNTDFQNSHTIPHEIFHRVQYRYNDTTLQTGFYGAIREGGARFVEDCISDVPNRYAIDAAGFFEDPVKSMQNPTPATREEMISAYGIALFWKYIAEQHGTTGEPARGFDAHRLVLEASASAADDYSVAALRAARLQMRGYGTFDKFIHYDSAYRELLSHETTWGNFVVANYLHGSRDSSIHDRFDYLEDKDPIKSLSARLLAIVLADKLLLNQGESISRSVTGQRPWAIKYYRLDKGIVSPRMLRVDFNETSSDFNADPLIQILRLGSSNQLMDVHRSDHRTYSKTINLAEVDSVVVIVATRELACNYTLSFTEVASAPDIMITRWNTAVGTEYEVDPRTFGWNWVSPDVMVDNDDNGEADQEVYLGRNNKLKVRLRNRGNAPANNISIRFWCQEATPHLNVARWVEIENLTGDTQRKSNETLMPGEEKWFTVDWAPVDDGTGNEHRCVKVEVAVDGDPNTDNKIALSNFAQIVLNFTDDAHSASHPMMLRAPEVHANHELLIIPRGPNVALEAMLPKALQKTEAKARRSICSDGGVLLEPTAVHWAELKPVLGKNLPPANPNERAFRPKSDVHYPVDPRTLPPGVDPESLVTVVHVVDGIAVGGITYQVDEPSKGKPS